MLVHPQFDPVAISVGPISVRWYGLMYLVGFAAFWFLGRLRAKEAWRNMSAEEVEDLLFYGVIAVILGGRLGYCIFYQPAWFMSHPLDVFKVWQGGMSAHGGILGVLIAMALFAYNRGKTFFEVSDFVTPLVPVGLMAGRIGNFINGELWGRPVQSDISWGMIFPQSGSMIARHPSQIYEAGLEGLGLFLLLWIISRKPGTAGVTSSMFCVGYGVARFFVEYFREPDSFLGLGLWGLSRGQWLSLPVLGVGLAVLAFVLLRKNAKA